MVSTVSGSLVRVAGPGAEFWELLATPTDFETIVSVLSARYGAPVEQVRHDLRELADSMISAGYVDPDD